MSCYFMYMQKPLTNTISAKFESTTVKSIHSSTILMNKLVLWQMFLDKKLWSIKFTNLADVNTQTECN